MDVHVSVQTKREKSLCVYTCVCACECTDKEFKVTVCVYVYVCACECTDKERKETPENNEGV